MQFKGFIGPAYNLPTYPLDCQRCVNLYPEPDELMTGRDNSIGALVSRPGLRKIGTLPTGPVRGIYTLPSTGQTYAVSGNVLYALSSSWTYTAIGKLSTNAGVVSMADNGFQLMLVDGFYGYVVNIANNNFQQVASNAFPGANQVIYQNGYFIFNKPGTGQFFLSGLLDGMSYNALDYATAEGSPDNLVALMPFRDQLVLFGSQTIEVWYNSGDPSFPYSRVPGGYIEHGCAAPLTPAKSGDTIMWLGNDEYGNGIVYHSVGFQPQRVSNYGVESALQSYSTISDAVGFFYQDRGHLFYVLTFPSAGATWVYDASLNVWHERSSYLKAGGFGRWRANCHTFSQNLHVVGDYEDGRLYALDYAVFTDDGQPIPRLRRSPHVSASMNRVLHRGLELDCIKGVGTDGTALGQVPQVMLRWSDDGGASWSSERWQSLGRLGQTRARVRWLRLGNSRNRVYEVRVTDPVNVAFVQAELDVEPCAS